MSEVPRLWSDFDGTAVDIAKKTNPRNWLKYPLPAMAGYADFLRGARAAGIEIAGVVTRRPDIFVRRMATARSITKLGLTEFFEPEQIVHRGSEEAKGRFVAEQSRRATIGMLEDRPHKLGAVLLGALSEPQQHPELPHHPILLGVVSHHRSQEYLERLIKEAEAKANGNLQITERASSNGQAAMTGLRLEAESLTLHVTPLMPYSEEAGQAFGRELLGLASQDLYI